MKPKGGVSKKYHISQWLFVLQDLLLPPVCAGCGKIGTHWCDECHAKLMRISNPLCDMCGLPQKEEQICLDCQTNPPYFARARAFARYENPFRKSIIRLKYQGNSALGETLSVFLIQLLLSLEWDFDMVIPVPLSENRRRKRGYNQTALLAYPISNYFNQVYQPYCLRRIRDTRSQVGLTGEERRENLTNAFHANENLVKDKTIILVDDVFTTGSTLNACSLALKNAGAAKVYGITLGRPVGYAQDLWDLS